MNQIEKLYARLRVVILPRKYELIILNFHVFQVLMNLWIVVSFQGQDKKQLNNNNI